MLTSLPNVEQNEFDFLVAHFHTWENAYPHEGWWEVYREAWDLLTAPTPTQEPEAV